MRIRPIAVVGALACLSGAVVLVDTGVAAVVDLGELALTAVGLIAVVQAVRFLALSRGEDTSGVALGDPEATDAGGIPGSETDRLLGDDPAPAAVDSLRDRLGTVAVDRLAVAHGTTEAAARDTLTDGTWTDDPVALAFLEPDRDYPLRIRLRARFGGPHPEAVGFEHAVRALREAGENGMRSSKDATTDSESPESGPSPTTSAAAVAGGEADD